MDDERFDGLYLNVAQQARGIEPLLDTVFSFLRRKTDFFSGPPGSGDNGTQAAIAKVEEVLQKHADIYKADQAKKEAAAKKVVKSKKAAAAAVKKAAAAAAAAPVVKPKEKDVLELGADGGFDVSPIKKVQAAATTAVVTKEEDSIPVVAAPPTTMADKDDPTTTADDFKDDDMDKAPPPIGNGGTVEGRYVWSQTLEELCLTIPLPEGTRGRDLVVSIAKKHLKIGLKAAAANGELLMNGPLLNAIICDDSFWTVEDGNRLVVNLQKLNPMEWWEGIVLGDPTIDVKKIQPESSNLSDLDGETRQTVEKMMFDQRQKAAGLPTSEEQHKFDMMEKFKKQHPEMDFSNVKMT